MVDRKTSKNSKNEAYTSENAGKEFDLKLNLATR
jgi:hypothetical protein